MKKNKAQKGYLLIELMVAISVFVIGILGFVGLLSNSLSLNREVADKFTANYLAAEGIEITKNLIDANILGSISGLNPWNDGFAGDFSRQRACFEVDYTNDRNDVFPIAPCNNNTTAREYLKFSSSTGYTYSSGDFTPFRRLIRISHQGGGPIVGDNYIKVDSIVTWQGRGGSLNEIKLEDYFFNSK